MITKTRTKFIVALTIIILLPTLLFSGCAPAATPTPETAVVQATEAPVEQPTEPPTAVPTEAPTAAPTEVKPEDITGTLVLYTAANEQMEAAVLEAFQVKYPNIAIQRINLSSGPVTSRIIAEMSNPQADVVWGLFESYMKTLRDKGAIEPYQSKDSDKVDPRFVDPDYFYVGHDLTLMGFGVNTQIMEEKGLTAPASWDDLIKPDYKGMINVASPAQSGTGMTIMTCLYDMYGGWDYIDKLHMNIFQYNSSGGAAGRQAARGEIAIGLTYDTAILSLKNEGFPIEAIFPPNTCYTIETGALIAGAKNPELGKLFLDFLASKEGMFALGKVAPVLTRPDLVIVEGWKPKLADLTLYTMKNVYDLEQFANDWLERYSK
jgi:iron(III) transport system substrate-binding protein